MQEESQSIKILFIIFFHNFMNRLITRQKRNYYLQKADININRHNDKAISKINDSLLYKNKLSSDYLLV